MIYIGYQGIGKSSISGSNNNIDLESGNFWVNGERIEDWYKIYCNIAEHLSNQGYNVFMSSHKIVREELEKYKNPIKYFKYASKNVTDENKKLKDNWNKLRELILEEGFEINTRKYGSLDVIDKNVILEKMQELEKGSDKK